MSAEGIVISETFPAVRYITSTEHLEVEYDGTQKDKQRILNSGLIPKGFKLSCQSSGYSMEMAGTKAYISNFRYYLCFTRDIKTKSVEVDAP